MKNKEEYTEWIDDYLDNRLTGEELQEFEINLSDDPIFQKEVQAQKAMRKALEKYGDRELKAMFKNFHKELGAGESKDSSKEAHEGQKKPFREIWWGKTGLAIAASLSILVIAGIWLMVQNRTFDGPAREFTAYRSFDLSVEFDTTGTFGYAGKNPPTESFVVELIQDNRYPFHYRFRDTLQVFSAVPMENPEINLQFEAKSGVYTLQISGKFYPLIRGLNRIVPLEETVP